MKEGWERKKLGEVCDFKSGTTIAVNLEKANGEIIYAKVGDMNLAGNEHFITGSSRYVDLKEINANQIIPKGSIIFPKRGGAIATNKKRRIIKPTIVDLNTMALVPSKIIDKDYLFFWFQQIDLSDLSNGTSIPQINNYSFDDVYISFPKSLPEQQHIVAILDESFVAIAKAKANAEQNLKNAKELFFNYLHSIVTNKSNGWEIKKLGEIAEYFNGLTYSPKDVNIEGIIVLRSSNVQNDELDFSDIVRVKLTVKEKIIVKEGDILMCSRNGSKRLVGKTTTIKNLDEVMTFGTFMMIIRSQYNPYLSWFFKSNDFRKQISVGENPMINQITRYMLDDVVLSFPPIESQNEIVQKLGALSAETKKLEAIYQQKLKNLEELKKSILQKAFKGDL